MTYNVFGGTLNSTLLLLMCDVQADLCYVSAFDDTEEPPSDTVPCADTGVDMSAAAADSDVVSGIMEVASAPALLMLSANDELPLTDSLSDLSLTAGIDVRPLPGTGCKPQLDNDFYFYQG